MYGVCEVIDKCLSVWVCGVAWSFVFSFYVSDVTNLSAQGCNFNWQPRQIYDQQPLWPWCPAFCHFCCFLSLSCLSVLSCQVCPAAACRQRDINKCCATQENTLNGRLRGKFFVFLVTSEQKIWTFECNECKIWRYFLSWDIFSCYI